MSTHLSRANPRAAPAAQAAFVLLYVLACALLPGTAWGAPEMEAPEYELKAAYLVNFAKYVDWPSGSCGEHEPLVIGILGENKVGEHLWKMVKGKRLNGRAFEIKHFRSEADLKQPLQILFVSASEKRRTPELLQRLREASVLTVGETDTWLAQGGMINFALEEGKVRLQVNLPAAEQARLKISAKLLGIAKVIRK